MRTVQFSVIEELSFLHCTRWGKVGMNVKISFHSALLFSSMWTSMQSHAMGSISTGLQIVRAGYNAHIGCIDTLMLKRATLQRGCIFTRQKINHHPFERDVMYGGRGLAFMPRQVWTETNPYIIHHRCIKDDGSELSKAVFDKMRIIKIHGLSVVVENPVNEVYNGMLNLDSVDQCTACQEIDDSIIDCFARFYDKTPLLAEAYKIRKELEEKLG